VTTASSARHHRYNCAFTDSASALEFPKETLLSVGVLEKHAETGARTGARAAQRIVDESLTVEFSVAQYILNHRQTAANAGVR
jgi:hypothetical protein